MAEPSDGPGSGEGRRRRRPTTPTIELTATLVPSEPVTEAVQPADTAANPETVPSEIPETSAAADMPKDAERPSPAALDEPPVAGRRNAVQSGPTRAGSQTWAAVGSLIGVLVGAVLMLTVLWHSGLMSPREPAALAARVAGVESGLRDLAGRPQPPMVEPAQVADLSTRLANVEQRLAGLDDLRARIAKLETAAPPSVSPASPDPALAARVAAIEAAVNGVNERFTEFGRRLDEVAAVARVAGVQAEAAKAAPAPSPATTVDRNARLALATAGLRAAVERGDPYSVELAATRPLVADAAVLAPLEPFAGAGVPSGATLSREVSGLMPTMAAAAEPPGGDGVLDWLQSQGRRLVRVRRTGEPAGQDASAILARFETKVRRGDIDGALAEFAILPPNVRAPAQAWAAKAAMRVNAIATARRLAADAVGALASP